MKNVLRKIFKGKHGKRNVALAIITFMLLNGVIISYGAFGNIISEVAQDIGKDNNKSSKTAPLRPINKDDSTDSRTLDEQKDKELKEKADKVEVDNNVSKKLGRSKKGNALNAYKKIVAGKKLSDSKKNRLNEYIMNYDDPQPVLILFGYMNDSYFSFSNLDEALARYGKGDKIEDIIQSYVDIENNFTPRLYQPSEIEGLLNTWGLAANDIALAEVFAYRGAGDFYSMINEITSGKDWESLSNDLGLINGTGQLRRMSISDDEKKSCMDEFNISEEEASKKIIAAKCANVKSEDIIKHIKSGKKQGQAIKEDYEKNMFNN